MDIETPVFPAAEQLPQIRRIARLEDIRKVIPPRREVRPPGKPKILFRFFVIGLLFFGILGFELAVIRRYDKLNKRLYQISVSLKDKIAMLQNKLQYAGKIRSKLIASRTGVVKGYFNLASQHKILQFKMDDYRNLSLAKSAKINIIEGDLRVAYARIEAVKVQNGVMAKGLEKKDEYIRELTSKLINSIGEQELLVNENLRLKEEIETLKTPAEVKDASQ